MSTSSRPRETPTPTSLEVSWDDSGKPTVVHEDGRPASMGVSLAHDDGYLLAVAGSGAQGCDLEPVRGRSHEDWIALLGNHRAGVLTELISRGDPLSRAGTRIWCVVEAVRKATGARTIDLSLARTAEDGVLFSSDAEGTRLLVLSFPITLSRGGERMVAVIAPSQAQASGLAEPHEDQNPVRAATTESATSVPDSALASRLGFHESTHQVWLNQDGPQGQVMYMVRFPLMFKHSSMLSRRLYFSHLADWVGLVREGTVEPVIKKFTDMVATGTVGLVTNSTSFEIVGEAGRDDVIECHSWMDGTSGPHDAVVDMFYDFRRRRFDGTYQRIARVFQRTTWVKVLDHGVVTPAPWPDYMQGFIDQMRRQNDAPTVWKPLDEPIAELDPGAQEFRAPAGIGTDIALHEETFRTSIDHANLVGNVYYSNYSTWQGRVRDYYFQSLIPELYRGMGENGEWVVREFNVDHLREAMPFDRVVCKMALRALYESAVELTFEYFREDDDGSRHKLAVGRQMALWVRRLGAEGQAEPATLPPRVVQDLTRRIRASSADA